jgi:hypothetical protein
LIGVAVRYQTDPFRLSPNAAVEKEQDVNYLQRHVADPIAPNRTGLPGTAEAAKIVGAMLTYGLIAAVAGIVIAASTWALGSHSSNPHLANRGKTGVLVSCLAALLIGGANLLVTFFANAGSTIA